MFLENNTEGVMNLVDMIDDLNCIDKIGLAIHLLEKQYFSNKYDENFIKLFKKILKKG